MIGVNEVVQKVIEKSQSSFDPSKRVSEVNGETKKTTYDPSKRVDTTSESNRENENKWLADINGISVKMYFEVIVLELYKEILLKHLLALNPGIDAGKIVSDASYTALERIQRILRDEKL